MLHGEEGELALVPQHAQRSLAGVGKDDLCRQRRRGVKRVDRLLLDGIDDRRPPLEDESRDLLGEPSGIAHGAGATAL